MNSVDKFYNEVREKCLQDGKKYLDSTITTETKHQIQLLKFKQASKCVDFITKSCQRAKGLIELL